MNIHITQGDCVEKMKELADDSFDSIVTDPPYGINFMGKEWDGPQGMVRQMATGDEQRGAYAYGGSHSRGYADNDNVLFQQWCETWLTESLRVLKPGGHLLAFGATRTFHRLTCAAEDAGFEIRDAIFWCYGSGFPKSMNVGKAVGKTEPQEAAAWEGWGTALKPAVEPIVVARKPLSEKTVAKNVLKHGTGGINIDGCRVGTDGGTARDGRATMPNDAGWENMRGHGIKELNAGRWPANLILGHSEGCKGKCVDDCPVANLDKQSGTLKSGKPGTRRKPHQTGSMSGTLNITGELDKGYGDSGGGSRFFHNFQMESPLIYQAKANKKERPVVDGQRHPTVKPLALMRNLVRLVTPPGGVVLDPFAGSGTTVEACVLEGFQCHAIEREPGYLPLIHHRVDRVQSTVGSK